MYIVVNILSVFSHIVQQQVLLQIFKKFGEFILSLMATSHI